MPRTLKYIFSIATTTGILLTSQHALASKEFAAQAGATCRSDIAASCAGVKPGGGRIIQCLQDTVQTLSAECKQAVMPDDGAAGTLSVEVTITGIQAKTGSIIVVLGDDPDKFPSGRRTIIVPANDDKVVVTFRHLKPERYAVLAIHDSNENNNFDPSTTPPEAIGFSNSTAMPPSFDSSAFNVTRDAKVTVALTYL
jgi:uncharacterized protein (DUF2141 family)